MVLAREQGAGQVCVHRAARAGDSGALERTNKWVTQGADGTPPSDNRQVYPSPNAARTLAHTATNLCPNPARPLLSLPPPSPSRFHTHHGT